MKIARFEGNRNLVTDRREIMNVGVQCGGWAGKYSPVGINRRSRNFDTLRTYAQQSQRLPPSRPG